MALQGSFYKAFGPGSDWKLLIEWKAVQDEINNKSTITAKAYLDTEQYGTMYASAKKDGSISIDGQSGGITKTGISNNGNQKTYLDEIVKTVTHNSEGGKNLTISAYFDFEVTLSGQWVGRVTASDNITLNTIPRASTLKGGQSFTAGSIISPSVSRASSKFRHELEYSIKKKDGNWQWLFMIPLTASQTSKTYDPTLAEKTAIFRHLDERYSADIMVQVQTFSGNTHIGNKDYTNGTVKAPSPSTITFPSTFNIGAKVTGKIIRNNKDFVHNIHLLDGSTKLAQVATGAGANFEWETSDDAATLYKDMIKANSKVYTLRVYTMLNGVQVQGHRDYKITAKVVNSNPTFTGGFTYKDINDVTVKITNNNQQIIQGQSKVSVTIPAASKATAKNYATMSKYVVTVNGVEKSAPYKTSDITIDFGIVNAAANVAITVKAIDSRNNSASASKTLTILPYKAPVITFTAERINGFEDATNIKVNGTYSQLIIGGAAKNGPDTISAKYQVQVRPGKGYGDEILIPLTVANGKISGSTQIILQKDFAYDVQLVLKDKIGSTTYVALVGKGRPLFHIDDILDALGFNTFPDEAGTFTIDGKLKFAPNRYGKDAAIDANNGDFRNLNGLFFGDVLNADGEGFHFLKTGKPEKSMNTADYDNLRVLDGIGYLNDKAIFRDTNLANSIWTGAHMMKENQTIYPNKPLDQCANGWILYWADYAGNDKADDFNYVPTYVHKSHVRYYSGKHTNIVVAASETEVVAKGLYINNTSIKAQDVNGAVLLNDIV